MKLYWLPLDQGLDRWNLICGFGHIILSVAALVLALGQSINLHSALSVGYYRWTIWPHSHNILYPDQVDQDQVDPHQIAFTLGSNLMRIKMIHVKLRSHYGPTIQFKLIWIKVMRIKFTLLQCERNNSVNPTLIRIKLIWINFVHSVNATMCISLIRDQLDC